MAVQRSEKQFLAGGGEKKKKKANYEALYFSSKRNNRRHSENVQKTKTSAKYEVCPRLVMVICIKQNLGNIWSSIHKKSKCNIEAELKKALLL